MSKSKSSEALLSKLKTSLPKPEANPTPQEGTDIGVPSAPLGSPPALISSTRAPKLSVSLYQADIQRLDVIKEFMKGKGFRNLNDSEALRLACRSVAIGDHFVAVYRDMQQEDGRTKRGNKAK